MAKKVYTKEEWEKKLKEVKIDRKNINELIMNYLIVEGYKDAAEKFQKESGTNPGIDLESIKERMAIRLAIQSGNIEGGIEKVNDLNPEILETNPDLIFHLKQQHLIELIREGDIDKALKFAQEKLAPQGEANSNFLEDLEKTMSLLAFEDHTKSPVSSLLDHSQRQKTASEVNAAILILQSQEKEPKLTTLLKLLQWAQQQASLKATFPQLTTSGRFQNNTSGPSPSTPSSSTAAPPSPSASSSSSFVVNPVSPAFY
eukprot:TRINITY_DN6769_c0_g1_i1.p1 TRINITY_DN6769_c0_g1~~TRINITY_DN6769_c0_g1_i1.p1  ORF type:complete len:258 (-),score=77.73 TRINITY_DN6769_c0_g1_i1:49-822(-)